MYCTKFCVDNIIAITASDLLTPAYGITRGEHINQPLKHIRANNFFDNRSTPQRFDTV